MFIHPNINPVAFRIGPLAVRWYGLMYLLAFINVIILGRYRIRTRPKEGWSYTELDDMLFYGVLGVVLGGRLGYVLFYQPAYYLIDPFTAGHILAGLKESFMRIIAVWQGGMSFHGGLLGVLFAMWRFSKRTGKPWFKIMDFIAPLVPLGLGAGRVGNFINGELWGRPTDVPWAMIYPKHDMIPRHPSEIYEFLLEGVLLFIIMWTFSAKPRPRGAISGLFLLGYGTFRFIAEFFRAPDAFLGLLWLGLSMGQWLSVPMIVIGLGMLIWAYRRGRDTVAAALPSDGIAQATEQPQRTTRP
ncbi:MAG: prolipoprotein diacylglyceryl transferase [Betaproteobacteria bacterium]|nr:prolipoprotein diacylglyceryl transferase [Betaproteobacteria bacterium]